MQERGTQDEKIQGTEEENAGLLLLRKGQKGIMHALFSRLGLFALLLILQVFVLFSVFHWFENILPHLLGGTLLFTILMVLKLLNSGLDSTAKNTWLVVIMAFPVFGILLYLYTQSEIGHRAVKARVEHLIKQTKEAIPQCEETLQKLKEREPGAAALVKYVNRSSCHPVFENTQVTYFPLGEAKWEEMLRQLEQAKEFIFMEYFIVDEGLMWGKVLDILSRKAQEGLDVRVMYDGTCEFANLPHDYPKRLRKLGIKCKMFSPLVPLLSTHYNYRDHRKILVIDGHTAFNGGVNLADEYINHIERFGHWKDTAVMLKGEAARSFTLMFLQMWNIDEKEVKFDGFLDRAVPA
ncbi:MAG: PLDc N-terminal domain-containing protein, partial [Lachnospiraceae bacterium]|nr:PLDc N-terminal domain-containing protein [Lachnospiraceae bacterium]